jgi:predicted RNA-binding protein YlxR (DUF448 family)
VRKKRHIPIRTCIGCRKKRKKEELIWFAQRPDGVVRVNPVRNSSPAIAGLETERGTRRASAGAAGSTPPYGAEPGIILKSNPAIGGTAEQWGIISNGVNGKEPHQGRGFYLCPDLGCFNMAKKKNRGVGFLRAVDLWYPSANGFSKSEKVWDRGGKE